MEEFLSFIHEFCKTDENVLSALTLICSTSMKRQAVLHFFDIEWG